MLSEILTGLFAGATGLYLGMRRAHQKKMEELAPKDQVTITPEGAANNNYWNSNYRERVSQYIKNKYNINSSNNSIQEKEKGEGLYHHQHHSKGNPPIEKSPTNQ